MLFGVLDGFWSTVRPEANLKRRFADLGSLSFRFLIFIMLITYVCQCQASPSTSSPMSNTFDHDMNIDSMRNRTSVAARHRHHSLRQHRRRHAAAFPDLNDEAQRAELIQPQQAASTLAVRKPKPSPSAYDALGDYFSLAKLVRRYKLHNRCSGKFLQIYLKEVNARGKPDSPLVDLRVETDSYGSRIRILSEKFNKYICFNKRNRIIAKYNGRNLRCVFVERIADNHYTELESAAYPGLYLGFNRQGRFIEPRKYQKKRHCFQYIKTEPQTPIDAFRRRQSAFRQPRLAIKKPVVATTTMPVAILNATAMKPLRRFGHYDHQKSILLNRTRNSSSIDSKLSDQPMLNRAEPKLFPDPGEPLTNLKTSRSTISNEKPRLFSDDNDDKFKFDAIRRRQAANFIRNRTASTTVEPLRRNSFSRTSPTVSYSSRKFFTKPKLVIDDKNTEINPRTGDRIRHHKNHWRRPTADID